MRKVNLRNVDPAIDDPDASTWCMSSIPPHFYPPLTNPFRLAHPTLNRHSPPDVVANFKRRVPPRLPKPRKRDSQEQPSIPPPRPALSMNSVPLTNPGLPSPKVNAVGRARGFSAPGSFSALNQNSAAGWSQSYPRSALPPLTVPSDPPHVSHNSMYNHSNHSALHPISLNTDDSPTSPAYSSVSSYSASSRDMMVTSPQYSYSDQNNWSFATQSNGHSSSHNSNLSSLLNPSSSGYSRPNPTINTSYASPFSSIPMQGEHSASSLSPDSRPATGYSMSSVSSIPYDDHFHHDYSRPNSSHRPISPVRPPSAKNTYGSLSIRRPRRHSQAVSPYPSPYEDQRPSSPHTLDDHQASTIPRVKSMIQLPSVDTYNFHNNSQSDFSYSTLHSATVGHANPLDSINDGWNRNVRPSTAASSISAASHTSSSQANTPPVPETYNSDASINRCE